MYTYLYILNKIYIFYKGLLMCSLYYDKRRPPFDPQTPVLILSLNFYMKNVKLDTLGYKFYNFTFI